MRKSFILYLTVMAVGLVGCLPRVQATPTSTASVVPRSSPTVTLAVPEEPAVLPDSGCTVITQKPTPGPTAELAYPPITSSDWVKGPAGAKVTIIEDSDFQ